jgi:hypothetical protein
MLTLLLVLVGDLESLKKNPGVESVEVRLTSADAKIRIIHIRDWHYVPKESFAADTRLKGQELDDAYAEHLTTVEQVQKHQREILRGMTEVYLEGLTDRDHPVFELEIRSVRELHRRFVELEGEEDLPANVQKIVAEHRMRLLRLGAAGRLMLEGRIKVLPAEGDEYEAANPVKDGKVVLDRKQIEDREDALVRRLLKPGTHVLILGGAHDLSDNIKRLSGRCEYTPQRVTAAGQRIADLVQHSS